MKKMTKIAASLAVGTILTSGTAWGQQATISNLNGASYSGGLLWDPSVPNSLAQTFSVDSPSALDTIVFRSNPAAALDAEVHVFEWNDAMQRVVGPNLFSTAVVSAPPASSITTVNTGGVNLPDATQYVFILYNPSGPTNGVPALADAVYPSCSAS